MIELDPRHLLPRGLRQIPIHRKIVLRKRCSSLNITRVLTVRLARRSLGKHRFARSRRKSRQSQQTNPHNFRNSHDSLSKILRTKNAPPASHRLSSRRIYATLTTESKRYRTKSKISYRQH